MIKINLLPQEMAGGSAGSASRGEPGTGGTLVALILILVFGVNAALGAYLFIRGNDTTKRLATIEKEHKAVTDKLNQQQVSFRENNASLERMKRLIEVAEQLDPPDRVLWARKLNSLPLIIPDGVFLTEINMTREIKEIETEDSIRKRNEWQKKPGAQRGPAPAVERIRNITQTVMLNGVSYVPDGSDTLRLQQINQFYTNMRQKKVKLPFDKEESSFMTGFAGSPAVASAISTDTFEGRQVSTFAFSLKTRPMRVN